MEVVSANSWSLRAAEIYVSYEERKQKMEDVLCLSSLGLGNDIDHGL